MFPEKNFLSIRLTEPVVPLHSTSQRASRHHDCEVLPPATVRGLLTLTLAKPTRVSSIEVELQARATTRYRQGVGPGRTDVVEQYKVHSASTMMFKAGPVPQVRQRATSAWPSVQFLDDHTSSDAQHSSRLGRLGNGHREAPSGPRSVSLDPRIPRVTRRLSSDAIDDSRILQCDQMPNNPAPPYSRSADQHSFLGADSYPSAAARSVGSSSRTTEPQSRDLALSRTCSIEEVPEDDSDSFETSAPSPGNITYYGLSRIAAGSSSRSSEQGNRSRSHSHSSFRKVVHIFDAVKGRVRSRSPGSGSLPRSDEQEERGRSLIKGKGKAQVSINGVSDVLPQARAAEHSAADGANNQSGDGWVVFPEGTYTYPIFFTIANNSPPTMKADHGSLIWKVKAEVKRPSAFVSKMTTQKEVIVVCLPKDSDSEEMEGLDLQRQWEDQLQYHVQIPGRCFPVGGKMSFQLTVIPLAKIKVHRISVYLDERTEYRTRAKTPAWSDAIRRATLLVIRHNNSDERNSTPILPLESDEGGAFRKSPLYRFLLPGEDESEVASSFMGSGPWTIHHQLSVPDSCSVLHPSNRARGSNVVVNHTLRIVLRVEKQEEVVMTGRKKLYDIVIHAPVEILSCRCTPEWTSLPRYGEALRSEEGSPEDTSTCPCHARQARVRAHSHASDSPPVPLQRATSHLTTDSNVLGALGPFPADSLASHNCLYELLMSGSVSSTGEAAPSYESVHTLSPMSK